MAHAVGDHLQVKIFCTGITPQQVGLNIRHWLVGQIQGTVASDQQLADGISTRLATLYRAAINATCSYFGLTVEVASGFAWFPLASSRAGTGLGVGSGDVLPGQVAGLISLRTGVAGRRNRGRAFIPFPSENDNTNGHPTGAYLTTIGNIGAEMVLMSGMVPPMSAAIYRLDGRILHSNPPFSFTPLTAHQEAARWATQRRRGDYGRSNVDPF